MNDTRSTLATYTLERYETEFADRHLLQGAIAKWARETPDRPAIVEYDTVREVTYREFDEQSTAYALKLIELGFQPGDFLGTLLSLSIEHIVLEYACFKIGVIHAPLDLRLKAPEVVRSLSLVEPKGFVFLGNTPVVDFTPIGRAVQSECGYVKHFIQFSPPGQTIEGAAAFDTFAGDALRLYEARHSHCSKLWKTYEGITASIKPTDGAQVIYTTGSTGFPKPALLSHRNITSQNMCLAAGFGLDHAERPLVHLPPSHVGCQAEQLITTFFTGQTAVTMRVFDAEKTLDCIGRYKVDCFGQVPAMFNMQWRLPNYETYDLSSVKQVMFGGQQVSKEFVRQLVARFGWVGTGLGLTEMAGFVTYTGLSGDADLLAESVGWDMPITPLSIRAPMNEDGTAGPELAYGATGEICFSGPQVFIDYVNNEEAYRKTVSKEGICYTGDLGYLSERGLIFCGRSKLVIKPKGYQVHPAQIESHFAELRECVGVCGAVGADHDVFSEGVVLFVELKGGAQLTRNDLETHAKGIAGYMRPLHYVLLDPGTFPLNRVNKTDYVRLREMAKNEIAALRSAGAWDRE